MMTDQRAYVLYLDQINILVTSGVDIVAGWGGSVSSNKSRTARREASEVHDYDLNHTTRFCVKTK